MKKLEIKLRHFEELETIMDKEREAVSFSCGSLSLARTSWFILFIVYGFSWSIKGNS